MWRSISGNNSSRPTYESPRMSAVIHYRKRADKNNKDRGKCLRFRILVCLFIRAFFLFPLGRAGVSYTLWKHKCEDKNLLNLMTYGNLLVVLNLLYFKLVIMTDTINNITTSLPGVICHILHYFILCADSMTVLSFPCSSVSLCR